MTNHQVQCCLWRSEETAIARLTSLESFVVVLDSQGKVSLLCKSVSLLSVLAALRPAGVPANERVLEDNGGSSVLLHSRRDDGPALLAARTAGADRVGAMSSAAAEQRVVGAPGETRLAE